MHTPPTRVRQTTFLPRTSLGDTPPSSHFKELTSLASYICKTPLALVSLFDAERCIFLGDTDGGTAEVPVALASSFCHHAARVPGVTVIPDARADARFSSSPLVVSGPRIRFYAGAPLVTSAGKTLGTLCTIDRRPRTLKAPAVEALRSLADQTTRMIELHQSESTLRRRVSEMEKQAAGGKSRLQMLPICSYCREVHDDDDTWQGIDRYLERHQHVALSYSICPDCYPKAMSDLEIPPKSARVARR